MVWNLRLDFPLGGTIVKFQLLLLPTISLLDMLQPTSGYILVRVVLAEFCCEMCPFNLFKIAVIVVKDFNNFRLLSDKSRANLFWLMIMMQMKLLMLLNVSSPPQPILHLVCRLPLVPNNMIVGGRP